MVYVMADISLRRIRREAHNVKSSISDKEFFLSNGMQAFAQDMVDFITKKYNRTYKCVVTYEEGETAGTDGKIVRASAANPWAIDKDRLTKFHVLRALILHEAAHNLFTDFRLWSESLESLRRTGELYPEPLTKNYRKTVLPFIKKYGATPIYGVYRTLFNAIEDAHIEERILTIRPGYKKFLREKQVLKLEKWPSYEDEKAAGSSKARIIINLCFVYATYGIIKAEDMSAEEVLILKSLMKKIDNAKVKLDSYERYMAINELFCDIFNIIEEALKENLPPEESEEEESGEGESGEGESGEGSDSSGESGEGESGEGSDGSGESGEESDGSEESEKGPASEETRAAMEEAAKQILASMPEEGSSEPTEDQIKNSAPVAAKGELGSVSSMLSEEPEEEAPEKGDASLKLLEEEMANEIVEEAIEGEIMRENITLDGSIAYDKSFHSGIRASVTRAGVNPRAQELWEKKKSLLSKSKIMTKELRRQIKDAQDGGKEDGLYTGKRIEAHSLTRYDKKFFSTTRLPEDIPDMAVMLLIDESGSMSGERIEIARDTAIILYNFCRECNIPISIVGHTADHVSDVDLISYAEFDSVDKKDNLRLMGISAKSNNRDGYALRYAAEKLDRRREDMKLLFVISDGYPAAHCYGHAQGKADVQNVVQTYRKKGMNIITAGIGSDRHNVETIYNAGLSKRRSATYLDISNMDNLPKTFVKIVKGFLEKEL